MSHVVKCSVEVKNLEALEEACAHLELEAPVHGKHRVYSTEVEGYGVKLKGWSHPVVFNLATGEAHYDNYGGSWGKQEELDNLTQRYGANYAKTLAIQNNYQCVSETQTEEGELVLAFAPNEY